MGDYDLRRGDCVEALGELAREGVAFDLVLADPPYGTTQNEWDVPLDLAALSPALLAVTRPDTPVLLFSQMPYTVDLVCGLRDAIPYRYEWAWEKGTATGFLNANRMPMRCHELVGVFYHRLPKYNPQMVPGEHKRWRTREARVGNHTYGDERGVRTGYDSAERYPRDVLRFGAARNYRGRSGAGDFHPTQKPVDLLRYLVRTYTDPGDIVLDFCMGSGSTGVACAEEGRRFVGVERDGRWFSVAERRVGQAYAQGRLEL